MNIARFKLTKRTCYFYYIAVAAVFVLPPMLFYTFHDMYNISYTLLGTLVLINFCTQLSIDLVFTFFSKYFNVRKTVILMPIITSAGLAIYALSPILFPGNVYVGLVLGTFIFSVASGLGEVLISPIIAAMPSDNPEKDMSILHSLYAWGILSVIVVSTIFFKLFGTQNWMYLTLFLSILPLAAAVLFSVAPIPDFSIEQSKSGKSSKRRSIGLALCTGCIFLGGAAEVTMTNWISVYMEKALQIPKTYGDIFGMALFALLLGIGRILYAKFGRNIMSALMIGMISSTVCYLIVGVVNQAVISFVACVLVGFFTAMLWPGTLILMEENISSPGIAAYALMAAAGDLGASLAPQLLGVIVDDVSLSVWGQNLAAQLMCSGEELGLKVGMLVIALCPLLGTILLLFAKRHFSKGEKC